MVTRTLKYGWRIYIRQLLIVDGLINREHNDFPGFYLVHPKIHGSGHFIKRRSHGVILCEFTKAIMESTWSHVPPISVAMS